MDLSHRESITQIFWNLECQQSIKDVFFIWYLVDLPQLRKYQISWKLQCQQKKTKSLKKSDSYNKKSSVFRLPFYAISGIFLTLRFHEFFCLLHFRDSATYKKVNKVWPLFSFFKEFVKTSLEKVSLVILKLVVIDNVRYLPLKSEAKGAIYPNYLFSQKSPVKFSLLFYHCQLDKVWKSPKFFG